MLTGFTNDTKQYFMKSSPVRPGDYLEFFAETNLLGALSACPGGDCGAEHSSDVAKCYPLKVSIWDVDKKYLNGISFSVLTITRWTDIPYLMLSSAWRNQKSVSSPILFILTAERI